MRVKFLLAATAASVLLAGCTTQLPGVPGLQKSKLDPPMIGAAEDDLRLGPPPPASPDEVRIRLHDPKKAQSSITKIRGDAIKEAASSYGSQLGYARRSWEIEKRLEVRSSELSQVFDFNRVVSAAPVKAGVIVPPVVARSFDAFTTDRDGREASVADEYLAIISAGRIAPVAPTWRDYLLFTTGDPELPPSALLPTTGEELKLFDHWKKQAWAEGVKLADAELDDRLSRLKRDYTGMLQYRRLVAQGMMDRMVLADADFGVTKEGNAMRIGSRTVEIVSDAQFQGDPTRWQVRSVSARDALIVETGEIPPVDSYR